MVQKNRYIIAILMCCSNICLGQIDIVSCISEYDFREKMEIEIQILNNSDSVLQVKDMLSLNHYIDGRVPIQLYFEDNINDTCFGLVPSVPYAQLDAKETELYNINIDKRSVFSRKINLLEYYSILDLQKDYKGGNVIILIRIHYKYENESIFESRRFIAGIFYIDFDKNVIMESQQYSEVMDNCFICK